jgi:F-type H+-transporting ATPase subunit delta
MAKLAANVYSEALFSLALEENRIDELQGELKVLCELIAENPEFMEFLATPKIGKDEKRNFVDSVLAGKFSQEIVNLTKVLIDKKRSREILEIVSVFDKTVLLHKDLYSATAYTAVPLSAPEMDALKAKLAALTGKQISLENIIDASVIGGIRLKVGDRVIDGSLKRRLEDLKDNLAQLIV